MNDLETLRAELDAANINYDNLLADHVIVERECHKLRAEVERLRAALEAEVKAWQGHTKMAVWSDSEECKVLTAEVKRLLKSRNRWATKYNDLLAKRRAEDGYDVYAAAREEYRKKIAELAAENEKLRAALRDARECVQAWAAYASEYFRDKHDLAGDLARIDAALEKKQ